MKSNATTVSAAFNRYHTFIIAILAILQFTIVVDFMVMAPLGALMTRLLDINASQFGLVVSVYGFSAGLSAFLTAGFADKFDRKKLLLFFYGGFIGGTLFCGMVETYHLLLAARILTGLFGGVMSSISFAIISDLFSMQIRGRVMGFVQMAFSASQILGVPLGLFLANKLGWHAPFLLIVGLSTVVFLVILKWMHPIDEHLKIRTDKSPLLHLIKILKQKNYLIAFATTSILTTGGFLLMPFSSTFLVYNVGVKEALLPVIYIAVGLCTIITGPLVGIWSDKTGKYKIFLAGSLFTAVFVLIYTHLSITPLLWVIGINAGIFIGVSSRIITSQALMTAVPDLSDRGGFMSINASIQQMSGGLAAFIGGLILVQYASKTLHNYNVLGYLTVTSVILSSLLMYRIHLYVLSKRPGQVKTPA